MATATAEPVTNGTATPPAADDSALTSSGTKRKRSDSEDAPLTDGVVDGPAYNSVPVEISPQVDESLRDILQVLRKNDTTPSILDCPLPKEVEDDSTSAEPASKRTKLSDSTSPTIARRVENGYYTSLEGLLEDVETAVDELLVTIKLKETSLPQTQYGRPSSLTTEESRLWVGTSTFQKLLGGIVQAEKERHKLVKAGKTLLKKANVEGEGTTSAPVKSEEEDTGAIGEGKPVLTVFANAPAPKQLFSSYQHSRQRGEDDGIIPPLREAGLPSFISTTNIPPIPADDLTKKIKGPTIGELFGPTTDKYKLQPPKPSKSKLVTTGNTVEFVRIDTPVRPNRRNSYNYFTDKLAVGQWLGYGGVDAPQEPTSPQAKRKQRDRALSTGEAFLQPTEGEKQALRKARSDALFRKVYGSFAPSYDDSTAIVPKDTRNEIWMEKVEDRLAQKTIVIDPALLGDEPQPTAEEKKLEMEELKEFVDNFDPALLEWDAEQNKRDREMEDILQEISELLETLSSFQRIRNASLSTSSRTTVGQNNPVTDLMGTPSTPSSAEMEVYKTLKLQLAVMVNQLPPYAVARLNGDQLEELNIKNSITIESEDARGVMTEDEATRAAKMQAYAAATGSQPQVGRTPSTTNYANYPASASQYARTPAPQQPLRPSAPSTYYTPQAQTQARPAPIPYQRSSSGIQSYSASYTPGANRSSFPQNFNQGTARSGQYQAPNNQYFQQMQNAATNKPSYSQNYALPGTPQPQRPPYQQTPASSYQRPPSTAPMYGSYPQAQSPHARTNSPQVAPPTQYNQRPGYSTPVSTPANPNFYRPPTAGTQPFVNSGYQPPRMQPASSASLTPSRQGSGTPQPPQAYSQPQQNGTAPAMLSQQTSS